MTVSSVETGPRIFMDPDNKDITPEQSHRRFLEEQKRIYRNNNYVSSSSLVDDDEFRFVTGLPLSKPVETKLVEEVEEMQAAETREPSRTALARVREWLSSLKPNTPQRGTA